MKAERLTIFSDYLCYMSLYLVLPLLSPLVVLSDVYSLRLL